MDLAYCALSLPASKRASPQTKQALAAKPGVEVVTCGEDEVHLPSLMAILDVRGVKSLIVEGGSTLLHSLFGQDLVSKMNGFDHHVGDLGLA